MINLITACSMERQMVIFLNLMTKDKHKWLDMQIKQHPLILIHLIQHSQLYLKIDP